VREGDRDERRTGANRRCEGKSRLCWALGLGPSLTSLGGFSALFSFSIFFFKKISK
jgi:hypothetical protein